MRFDILSFLLGILALWGFQYARMHMNRVSAK